MNSLYNLPIRAKFGIIIIPLVLIIVFFDFFQIKQHYLDYNDSNRLNKAIVLGVEINHVVHEIQKERGITAGFLSSEGAEFALEMTQQRRVTDSTLNAYYQEIKQPGLKGLMTLHRNDIDKLDIEFGKLGELRNTVDALSITSDQCIEAFADINFNALNTVNMLINESRDKEVTQEVHAMIYFLKSKELSSIERAVGTQILSAETPDTVLYRKFS
ncbi:MAG: nitrate- and nitrite sensing domain-containing protein, partial [Bacteroidota bacterium]